MFEMFLLPYAGSIHKFLFPWAIRLLVYEIMRSFNINVLFDIDQSLQIDVFVNCYDLLSLKGS